ncbi:MAG: hypothetical protein HY291_00300 [Planctomycetes bacterium]|nr:hypothetical protein [Planctomycetota bacterium]
MLVGTRAARFVACLMALVFCAVNPLKAEEPASYRAPEFREADEVAYSQAEADAMLAEMLPLVERAAGRSFKSKPKALCANRDRVAAAIAQDLLPQIRKFHPTADPNDAAQIALDQAVAAVPLMLVRYGYQVKALCFLPKNAKPLVEAAKADTKQTKTVVKLVAAFELVHALQDQEVDIQKVLDGARDGEASVALNALLQGQAVYVVDQIAKDLNADETTRLAAQSLAANALKRGIESMDRLVDDHYREIYLGGRAFVAYHVEKGGMEKVWGMFQKPPNDTNTIHKPETYTGTPRAFHDYSKALEGLEKELGDQDWKILRTAMGPAMMRAAYQKLDADKREALVEKIETGQALTAAFRPKGLLGNLSIIVLKDAAFAKQACEILESFTKKELETVSKENPVMRIEPPETEDLKGLQTEYARSIRFEVESPGEPLLKQRTYRIARGRHIFELVDQNIGLAPEKAVALAEKVFKRLLELEAETPKP